MCKASEIVKIALNEVGYLEKASNANLDDKTANAGSNNFTKYARDLDNISGFYNGKKNGFPWCDVFVDWCFVKAFGANKAKELLCQPDRSLGAGCGYSIDYYKKKGQFHISPAIGDQIFFKSGNSISHTGIVYDVDKTYVYTVEGNTSSASGVVVNGGSVAKKKYSLSYSNIAGYGRPSYDKEESVYKPTVREWQKAAIADGYKFPKYGADGQWGNECKSVATKAICKKLVVGYRNNNLVKIIQKVVGVTADGKFGNNTKKAVISYQKKHGLAADGIVGYNTWRKILGV